MNDDALEVLRQFVVDVETQFGASWLAVFRAAIAAWEKERAEAAVIQTGVRGFRCGPKGDDAVTMRLTIRNEDQQRVASVTVEEYKIGQANPSNKDTQDLEPGQSREVYVHASRRVVITENADATRDAR